MTDNNHPITPPPELVQQWWKVSCEVFPDSEEDQDWVDIDDVRNSHLATQAARWGADQELEACCEWLGDAPVMYNDNGDLHPGSYLRDARRPKPLLKEEALLILKNLPQDSMSGTEWNILYAAIEQLPD